MGLVTDYIVNIVTMLSSLMEEGESGNARIRINYLEELGPEDVVVDVIEERVSAGNGTRHPAYSEKEFWTVRACGMACLRLIIATELNEIFTVRELTEQCMAYGGYGHKKGEAGLVYRPFIRFIEKEFGLKARYVRYFTTQMVRHYLDQGDYVIVSVSQDIHDVNTKFPSHLGGHKVLITGYDESAFTVYNPLGTNGKPQKDYRILDTDLRRFFSRKGVVVKNRGV